MYDSIIIGKGPAGITAAIYIKRANLNCLVIGKNNTALEKAEKIDNYYGFPNGIAGKDLFENGIQQAKKIGVEIITDEVLNIQFDKHFIISTKNNEYISKTVIIATGTNRKRPNIKGIKKYEGKGISYCAICDAFFYRNKDVAVLGEGDYALNELKELQPIARSVTMLTNGAEPVEKRSEPINIIEKEVREFRGEEVITDVVFGDNSSIPVSGVFIASRKCIKCGFGKKSRCNNKK